jgi:hypothetical protein
LTDPEPGSRLRIESEEGSTMASDGLWRTLGKVANVIGILWALAALGVLGYFGCLGLSAIQLSRGG